MLETVNSVEDTLCALYAAIGDKANNSIVFKNRITARDVRLLLMENKTQKAVSVHSPLPPQT